MEQEIKVIMWFILIKLKNMRKWGGAHSELTRILKSLPNSCKDNRLIKKAVKNLVNLEYIGVYKKTGEDHVSLNPRKVEEINKFLTEGKDSIGNEKVYFGDD